MANETVILTLKDTTGAPTIGSLSDGEMCVVVPDGTAFLRVDDSTLLKFYWADGLIPITGDMVIDAKGTTKAAPRIIGVEWTGSGSSDAAWLQFGDAANGILYSDGEGAVEAGFHPKYFDNARPSVSIPDGVNPDSEGGRSNIMRSSQATRSPLTARGAVNQTANLFEVENSGKTKLAGFDKEGNLFAPNMPGKITVGATAPSSPNEGDLWVDTN